ncbi:MULTISPECIES: c-type cytochrome [Acaryochloris]|uniref:c-type cytochrome n=1 Tax=Acaryochloris TaxID=155977 RepID=UPI001F30A0CD|nr:MULTISPECIES: c-type cytochrome [Acaryochloris]
MKLFSVLIAFSRKAGLWMGLIGVWLGINLSPAWATPPEASDGAMLFENYCAGCHPKGGNIIRRGKTLKLKSLKRDSYDTLEPLTGIVTEGQNNMPGFADKLDNAQVETVAQFVLEQANHNWK